MILLVVACASLSSVTALPQLFSFPSSCNGPIQHDLKYNASHQPNDTPSSSPSETLAEAICCDTTFGHAYAEPSGWFAQPGVDLFSKISPSGTTIFYDSVCGLPLFEAPIGRSFAAWRAESEAHGWPSFRDPELIKANVVVGTDGEVHSTCGTHLGHNLPDAGSTKARYCLDLVCLAGRPAKPAPSAPASAPALLLVTFDGAHPGTSFNWREMDDPVMGGRSAGSFSTVTDPTRLSPIAGKFHGHCAVVPFLHAPGFCKATAGGKFHDASAFISGGLQLYVKSSTPAYTGFKVAFGAVGATRPRPSRHGGSSFKANFALDSDTGWQLVKIPFHRFSVDWSEYTGDCSTKDPTGEQHVCCTSEHPEVCPTAAHLKKITSIEVWAEGVEGEFDLEIAWIGAGSVA